MRKFLHIFTASLCVFAYSNVLNVSSTPTKPDYSIYDNAERHFEAWRDVTIPQAVKQVNDAFAEARKIGNDFKRANKAMLYTMGKTLPAGIKNNMTSALSSALGITLEIAKNHADAMTLADATYTAFQYHETKLKTFNDYWDGSGSVTKDDVMAKVRKEIEDNGVAETQSDTLMEAFYRFEYALWDFNNRAKKWNAYVDQTGLPDSEKVPEQLFSDPVKPGFTQIHCFNDCGDIFDTFSEAEGDHKEKCGTADDVDIEAKEELEAEGWSVPERSQNYKVMVPHRAAEILLTRKTAQGCGRSYYDCPNKPAGTEHNVQTCSIWVWEKPTGTLNAYKSYQCGFKFRECMGHERDHNPHDLNPFKAKHSASGDSSTDNPDTNNGDDDEEEASITPSTPSTPSATVPGPPAYVSAQGYNGLVSVSFASPSNNGGADITSYKYRYSVTYGTYGDWITWDSINNPNISVNDLNNGTQYQFQVRAVNSVGDGTVSDTVYATPVAPCDWDNIPDPYRLTVGVSFRLNLKDYVEGFPTITHTSGTLPAGLSLSNGVLSGTPTSAETQAYGLQQQTRGDIQQKANLLRSSSHSRCL